MEVVIVPTAADAGAVVADVVARAVAGGARALGLATGSSPLAAYGELARRHRDEGLDLAGVHGYLLDEYVGLGADHPQSYARTIREVLTRHVGLPDGDVHGPDGAAEDPVVEAARYDALLRERGPVDVQLLGIGANGHVGFNEPGSSLASRTRVKTLTARTRADNARFFGAHERVPHHVITQGLGTVREARHLVLVADGAHKAAAVAAAVEGPLSARCPASVLQLHPHSTVVVDEAAASGLQDAEHYRWTQLHRLPQQPL